VKKKPLQPDARLSERRGIITSLPAGSGIPALADWKGLDSVVLKFTLCKTEGWMWAEEDVPIIGLYDILNQGFLTLPH